ncbi:MULTISPECIES: hypothetical protein [Parageobacillus]|jgi:hypothetical protein|nr:MULTISPECIES: hypothetical protein [Parageobacillus]BDG48679.1 hypothetical protein PspKH34_32400 [Parageobacillus sp. KH3-4]
MKINLTVEQAKKFLLCFVEDAKRIVKERKRQQKEAANKGKAS